MQGPKRILIVEPDEKRRQTLLALLRDDYELASAESGDEAWEKSGELYRGDQA